MKLSGCKQGFTFDDSSNMNLTDDGEFTCNDGQCVSMRSRCDHFQDCEDGSDEKGCYLIALNDGYNKKVAPFKKASFSDNSVIPVGVNVTIRLLSIISINEVDNSIDLQFEINLDWKDSRMTYSNLKDQPYLNTLTDEDINNIWLPLVIYDNTDQKETTRLGWTTEWSTSVNVVKEGNFTRKCLLDSLTLP